jgi:hypothetical protein
LDAAVDEGNRWIGAQGPSIRRQLGAAGAGHSGRCDVSERIEEILAAEVPR